MEPIPSDDVRTRISAALSSAKLLEQLSKLNHSYPANQSSQPCFNSDVVELGNDEEIVRWLWDETSSQAPLTAARPMPTAKPFHPASTLLDTGGPTCLLS